MIKRFPANSKSYESPRVFSPPAGKTVSNSKYFPNRAQCYKSLFKNITSAPVIFFLIHIV